MKRQFEKNGNYELERVKTVENYTIVELFLRQEGVNSAFGFLFSCDSNKNFKYNDVSEIDSVNAEDIIGLNSRHPRSNSLYIFFIMY
jgi:hypothetical protein